MPKVGTRCESQGQTQADAGAFGPALCTSENAVHLGLVFPYKRKFDEAHAPSMLSPRWPWS